LFDECSDTTARHSPDQPPERRGKRSPSVVWSALRSGLRPSLRSDQTTDPTGHHSCRSTGHRSCRHGYLINRLIFSHQVTALEAYLGDTLMNVVASDADAMQRLIDGDDDLSKQKFTLAEIRKEPGLVERKVREHLRTILYHNLAKVDALYGIALGIRILSLTDKKPDLFRAVMLRHDCVHRNGFDKEGLERSTFTREFVRETADMIRSLVESIERAIRERPRG
jgi:hypothetical protein